MSLLLALISGGGGITGTLAASESGSDTFAATGQLGVIGSLAATETGSDTFAATGTLGVFGALAATEVGSDTFAATGTVSQIVGDLAASEVGSDTFAASGEVTGDAVPQGGGMGGWGRERAVLEWSIRERMAQQTLQKSTSKPARRIAAAMADYSAERIAFDELRIRTLRLAQQLERQQGLAADLRQAARDVRQFIEDEQDALEAILAADALDAELLAVILH